MLVLLMLLSSRLISRSGLRISHSKVFSSEPFKNIFVSLQHFKEREQRSTAFIPKFSESLCIFVVCHWLLYFVKVWLVISELIDFKINFLKQLVLIFQLNMLSGTSRPLSISAFNCCSIFPHFLFDEAIIIFFLVNFQNFMKF